MTQIALGVVLACCVTSMIGASQAQTPRIQDSGFYVVLDARAKTCSVVDKEPKTDSPNVTVATDAIYKTRAEAEAALPTLKACAALKAQEKNGSIQNMRWDPKYS